MYSNSSSFLGGGNSNRPGGPQYREVSFQQQHQQQPPRLGSQLTGVPGAALQAQYTAFPGHDRVQDNFQVSQQQSYQSPGSLQVQSPNQDYTSSRQSPATGQLASNALRPTSTGQTSSQIAQSFQGSGPATGAIARPNVAGVKIPKIRLSFLTAQDQAKFEQLFKSAVGDGQVLDGTQSEVSQVM